MPQYQGVWTLEQQAQALTNQQWVTDPNFRNTTLLLQADGTGSGSQNQTFLDGSTNNFFITRNGNTTQGSFSPFSQAAGYWGNYFGSGNYLTVSYTATNVGTGDFTIECWVYITSYSTYNIILDTRSAATANALVVATSQTTGYLYYYNGTVYETTMAVPLNTWTHVAVSRTGTTIKLFVGGAEGLSRTDSSNLTGTSTGSVFIGSQVVQSAYFNGYISNLRVVKGTGVYTSAFTPSTSPLTAITNTSLLTCQSNRFVDNSTNAFAITLVGAPSVQAFGPFAPALQWTPDVVGGSAYFDGTGDYLVSAGTVNWSTYTNLTVELWVYPTNLTGSTSTLQAFVGTSHAQNDGYTMVYTYNDGKVAVGINGTNEIVSAAGAIKANTWSHVAVVKVGSTTTIYVNGVSVTSNTTGVWSNNSATVYVANTNTQLFTGYISGLRLTLGSAVYTTAFTPPTAPPTAITNTSLLLNYTNAGIYDGKMANVLETVGNAQVATSPVKYGSGSMYFNGSSSYLRSQPTTPLFAIGTTYTIEGWFYRLSNTSAGTYTSAIELIGTQPFGTTTTGFLLTFGTSGGLYFYDGANATVINYANATTLIPLNQWNHIAVVRTGGGANNVTLFVNGIAVATGTSSSAQSTVQSYFIGGDTNNNGCFTGYMDDVRVTVGVARYFANFTPPQQALPRQ